MATLTITNKTVEPAFCLVWGRSDWGRRPWSYLTSGSTLAPLPEPGGNSGDKASVLPLLTRMDANGGSTSFPSLPPITSGQVFLAFGALPTEFSTVRNPGGGVGVQPPSHIPDSPNGKSVFCSVELTITGQGHAWANTTAVDAWAAPVTLALTGPDRTQTTGELVGGASRNDFFRAFEDLPGPLQHFERLIVRTDDGRPVRVLAPGHAIEAGRFPRDYYDAYLAGALNAIRDAGPLRVVLAGSQYAGTYVGTVGGDGQSLEFRTPGSDAMVHKVLLRPGHAKDVFFCNGDLRADNDLGGALAARVGACANRSVLQVAWEQQPITDPGRWYQRGEWNGPADAWATNEYARVVSTLLRRVYGFAFDDVRGEGEGDEGPLLHEPRPLAVDLTLEAWA